MPVLQRLIDYALLMRLDRPIGSLLLLWPTLWALWLAGEGQPPRAIVTIFVVGVFLMRSAGCVINDYADRDFDPYVARTRNRPLAAGRVSANDALVLFALLCLTAFVLVLQLNRLTVLLSVPAVLLAASYPFMKRFHHLPQIHLGAAFGWSIPMAFAAVTGTVPAIGWLLFLANIIWSVAYDTAYAMVDREDDLQVGVKSTAILFGPWDRTAILIGHGLVLVLLVQVGRLAELAWPYYAGLAVAAWSALYQQYLMRNRDTAGCFQAFLHNNAFGLAVFVGLAMALLPG